MGRTSLEQELVIDILDDLMTFAYAYEGELGPASHIPGLDALGRDAVSQMQEGTNLLLFGAPQATRYAVFGVLNRLQYAAAGTALPEQKDHDRAWVHSSPDLTVDSLRAAHARHADTLLQLVEATAERLAADPTEARVLMTREQVRGTLLATLPAVPACAGCPIHLQSLVALVHQNFLAALDDTPACQLPSWREVVRQYMGQAEGALKQMAQQLVLDTLERKLLPAARDLTIDIGRFYPWAAVWDGPAPAGDLLTAFRRLNASRTLRDAKYKGAHEEGGAQRHGFEFIYSWAARRPRLLLQDQGSATRIFFNTDDVDIRIGGRAVQKHAMMAMRYDLPLRELEEKIGRFRNYLLTQRRRYCATGRQPLRDEELGAIQRSAQDAMMERKTRRTVLHDTSSVLGHLCGLLWLQRRRDRRYGGMSAKAHHIAIQSIVENAGFQFSLDSVRKACANGGKLPARVRRELAGMARS